MGQKPSSSGSVGGDDRRLSSPPLHAGPRGKSMKQLPVPGEDGMSLSGGGSVSSFSKRVQRNAKYDDVALLKARITYDDVRSVDKLEKFLKMGGDINYVPHVYGLYDWTLLHWAAFFKITAAVKALVTKGANVNLKTSDGEVPARIAKSVGASSEILRLLEAGRLLGGM